MRRIVISPDKYEPSSRCDRWHVAVVFTWPSLPMSKDPLKPTLITTECHDAWRDQLVSRCYGKSARSLPNLLATFGELSILV